ncbi:MAG: hypothetical protein ACXACI_01305 [Candidatus Hodarchaeales archaeon]
MAFLFLDDPQIAILVLLAEIIFILALLMGWYFGARRLNIDLHHLVVYIAVPVQFVLLVLWMLPKPLKSLDFLLDAPIKNWNLLAHFILGLITIGLALGVVITFIIYRGVPLTVLRKVRPVMIAILLLWIVTFSLGAWNFYKKYYPAEEEEEEEPNGSYPYPSSTGSYMLTDPFDKLHWKKDYLFKAHSDCRSFEPQNCSFVVFPLHSSHV